MSRWVAGSFTTFQRGSEVRFHPRKKRKGSTVTGDNAKVQTCERGEVQCIWGSGWRQGRRCSGWGSRVQVSMCGFRRWALLPLPGAHPPRCLHGSFTSFRPCFNTTSSQFLPPQSLALVHLCPVRSYFSFMVLIATGSHYLLICLLVY